MTLTASVNTVEKTRSEQLFDAYLDFQKDDTIKQKNFLNFQGYIKSKNLWFSQAEVGDVFEDLGNPEKRQEIMKKLEPEVPEANEKAIEEIEAKTEMHQEEMAEATEQATQEKTMKMEELTNLLNDKPENAEKNAELIVEQSKARIKQTVDRYTDKLKELKTANEAEKEKLNKELADIRTELKKEKDTYEKVKKDFFAPSTYNFEKFTREDLKKASTRMVRYATREGKLFNSPRLTKMATIRRNITMKTLIRKFNNMGNESKKWVRFVMGFEKARFLRYTGVKINSMVDQAWSAMGLQMNPQDFHKRFNKGRMAIFSILDADTGDEKTAQEKEVIQAIKNRINYYWASYARERANAWVAPFVEAEKKAPEAGKIIQMNTPAKEENLAKAA